MQAGWALVEFLISSDMGRDPVTLCPGSLLIPISILSSLGNSEQGD